MCRDSHVPRRVDAEAIVRWQQVEECTFASRVFQPSVDYDTGGPEPRNPKQMLATSGFVMKASTDVAGRTGGAL